MPSYITFFLLTIAVALTCSSGVGAFSVNPVQQRLHHPLSTFTSSSSTLWDKENDNDGDNMHARKVPQTREAFLEQASRDGADKVSKMSVEERTKRSMLAEAVEDSMYRMEIQLEEILGEEGIIPTDPEEREQCVSLAKQIKVAQKNYQDLVMGEPSAMLATLDGLGKDDK